ncbi:hypothetical protein HDU80_003230 [Chytriomyces hyalinus]|nr:hypothetical protein HDU80_003230 [Chytriomyces hyalinus]
MSSLVQTISQTTQQVVNEVRAIVSPPVTAVALPVGWSAQWSPQHQRHFFVHMDSGMSQWDPPALSATVPLHAVPQGAPIIVAPNNSNSISNSLGNTIGKPLVQMATMLADDVRTLYTNATAPTTSVYTVHTPALMPRGWVACWSVRHSTFYYVAPGGVSQWHPPAAPPASETDSLPTYVPGSSSASAHASSSQSPSLSAPVPPGWRAEYSAQFGRFFYVDNATGFRQWEPPLYSLSTPTPPQPLVSPPAPEPAQLPPGWISQFSEGHQRHFYVNTTTGVSQWTPPLQNPAQPLPGTPVAPGSLHHAQSPYITPMSPISSPIPQQQQFQPVNTPIFAAVAPLRPVFHPGSEAEAAAIYSRQQQQMLNAIVEKSNLYPDQQLNVPEAAQPALRPTNHYAPEAAQPALRPTNHYAPVAAQPALSSKPLPAVSAHASSAPVISTPDPILVTKELGVADTHPDAPPPAYEPFDSSILTGGGGDQYTGRRY